MTHKGQNVFKLQHSKKKNNTNTFANSFDPHEMAYNETSHQDLHCLPFCFLIFD